MATVTYGAALDMIPTDQAEIIADRYDSYFNRDGRLFCSHQHTPNEREPAGPVITVGSQGARVGFDVCQMYLQHGMQTHRELFLMTLRALMPIAQITTSMPSSARVTLMRQPEESRDILHLLSANPCKRGQGVEVIEDLIPLYEVDVAVKRQHKPSAVTLQPEGVPLSFDYRDGCVHCLVPKVLCHQMIEIAD